MDLTPYVDHLHDELLAAADSGEATTPAERLAAAVAASTRLTMLDVLSAAADEITRDLVPGSVEVRLHGRNPYFVVTPPVPRLDDEEFDRSPGVPAGDYPPPGPGRDSASSRINFRPPGQLKRRIEEAAAQEGISVNAWLIRAVTATLAGSPGGRRVAQDNERVRHFIGWVG